MELNLERRISSIILLISCYLSFVLCSPLNYDLNSVGMYALPPPALTNPYMMGHHFDPYTAMQAQVPFYMSNPFASGQYESLKRSVTGGSKKFGEKFHNKHKANPDESDEQKALGDLPLSFIEPDGPSTLTERISDSFSAIGEGVRNHFRSMTENFSDTVDDIKDAWRSQESSRKSSKY